MKRFATLLAATLVSAAVFAQQKDIKFSPEDMKSLADACPKSAATQPQKTRTVLVFSRTCGFRHTRGIPAAKEVFAYMGDKLGLWKTVVSDDLENFTPENLKKFDCVIMNNTTAMCFGEPVAAMSKMSKEEQIKIKERSDRICKNVIEYVKNGGGLLAIHAAVDCYNYDNIRNREYTDMLGGEFTNHPWYMSNAPETMIIDDPHSPVIKGIWNRDAFRVREEVYMLGKSYDRSKCRVLVRLDFDRSPLTTSARERDINFRVDGDFAAAYIKSFGKGRIAYTTFGHDYNNYLKSQFQEFYMRLAQFCCGDLKADTSSIPFVKKSIAVPMDEKPPTDRIRKFSDIGYDQKFDEKLNDILFAVYTNNLDKRFCAELENFACTEIENKAGTPNYRAYLAELIWAAGIQSEESCNRIARIAATKGLDEGIRGRLSNAIDHWKKAEVFYVAEKEFAVPAELPSDPATLARLIQYLAKNPKVEIPAYLGFDSLEENGKARLVYALIQRGENASKALSLTPKSEALAVALAAAAAKYGDENSIEKIVASADLISPAMRPIAVSYIISIKSQKVPQKLMELIGTVKTPAQSALVVSALTKFDLEGLVSKLFDGFDAADDGTKLAKIKTAESIASPEVFRSIVKMLPTFKLKKTANAAIRTLLKCATSEFDPQMFVEIAAVYPKCDKSVQENLVRFAAFASNDAAIDFVKKAYSNGYREQAVKTLGEWKTQDALAPLAAIAKSVKGDAKIIAQQRMANVGARAGLDAASLEYLLKNAVREEEKLNAVESAVKFASSDGAEILRKNGFGKEAEKVEGILKNAKTVYRSGSGENTFKFAFDNNRSTRWTTGRIMATGDWLSVDFGFAKKTSEIGFDLGTSRLDFPTEFEVYAGSSDSTLAKVSPKIGRGNGFVKIVFEPPLCARIIKIVVLKCGPFYWSAHEISVK